MITPPETRSGGKIPMKPSMPALLPVALLFTLGLAAPSRAQQSSSPAPAKSALPAKPYGNADAPENDPALQLTDDQKAKIKTIRDDASQQLKDVQKDTTLTDDQKERKVKMIRKTTRAQVFAVLTLDQQKTWSGEQHEKHEGKSQPPKPQ
jgi:Spy/CpxP family protein refolding chaperone